MSRTVDKAILTVYDIWLWYIKGLMAKDPTLVTRRGKTHIAHCYLSKKTVTYKTVPGKIFHQKVGSRCKFTYLKTVTYEDTMSYYRFRRIIEHYFNKAKIAIIQGEAVSMGGVGKICARRVERDFTSFKQQQVDWGKTNARGFTINPETGKKKYNKVILMTTTDWCRIGWHKDPGARNKGFYQFLPASANSAGTNGFQLEFSQALRADPLLKFQYLYMKRSDKKYTYEEEDELQKQTA